MSGEGVLPTFFEFFAGGGMVHAGLDGTWTCKFANDFDLKKAETYRANWGSNGICPELSTRDVNKIDLQDLPTEAPDLIWASFPCQDLSLAGAGAGLKGDRSGTFRPFWAIVRDLDKAKRTPKIIVLENVCGALSSHGGRDFAAIVGAFSEINFDVGAVVIDAELFVPQSRPRLFFIGIPQGKKQPPFSLIGGENSIEHPASLMKAYHSLPAKLRERWIWWDIPKPPKRNLGLIDILEDEPKDVEWHTAEETKRLLSLMSPLHQKKLKKAQATKTKMVGAMYRRTRPCKEGGTVQRVEVRFDNVAGCLRTPAGGSSRQLLALVDGHKIRTRLISARETARLMGLKDDYKLPERYNEAYHLTGDGVVVNVVKHLSEHVLLPAVAQPKSEKAKAPRSNKKSKRSAA